MLVFASRKPTTGGVVSVVAGASIAVNDTDPANPVVSYVAPSDSGWVDLSTLGYENGWGDGPNPAQFRVIGNLVYFRGQITGGGNGDVVTTNPLPADARAPIQIKLVCCPDGYAGNAPSCAISPAGVMNAYWTGGSGMTLAGVYIND